MFALLLLLGMYLSGVLVVFIGSLRMGHDSSAAGLKNLAGWSLAWPLWSSFALLYYWTTRVKS